MNSRFRSFRAVTIAITVPAVASMAAPVSATGPMIDRHDSMAESQPWILPVGPPGGSPPVVHGFDPPDQPWHSGHRGVDLDASEGATVHATADGVVTFAGVVAGTAVVSLSHGDLRSTYQPVTASVSAGDTVTAGAVIGTVEAEGSHCRPDTCLHWGAVRGETYVDPLDLLGGPDLRLLPLSDRALTEDPPAPGANGLTWPVAVPYVTSPFGMRVHPITGVRKLHDGTDFRARCGTPVRAAAPGVVTAAGERGAYGLQISIDHGTIAGIRTTTSSSHLSRLDVHAGERVTTGQIIGRAGTTGLSTGCHVHFMVYDAGGVVDPMSRLPTPAAGRSDRASSAGREDAEPPESSHPSRTMNSTNPIRLRPVNHSTSSVSRACSPPTNQRSSGAFTRVGAPADTPS